MKRAGAILFVLLMFRNMSEAQTGADCTNAIPLVMDGVCRTFATSASTGTSINCIDNTGSAPITYFSFTTNSVPDKVMINITGPSGQPVEVIMQPNSCAFNYSASNMCFYDGEGVWSTSHVFTPVANTTYKLRVRTNVAGNITICAQYYTPLNDNCAGAFSISSVVRTDNNATHTAGPGVIPADLCASTLENTAFYSFIVDADGVCIINLNNIKCDNSYGANSNGFQIGFFTGSCSGLVPISCYSGSGSFVSATTSSLTAGTNVYVAIDGTAGSNCSYEISAFNAQILAASIKNFVGWKKADNNLLNWTILDEKDNSVYEIQRSYNRKDFTAIGEVKSSGASAGETQYRFEETNPPPVAYYRLKLIVPNKKASFSKVVLLKRTISLLNRVEVVNPVIGGQLNMRVYSEAKADYNISIINTMGQLVMTDKISCRNEMYNYQKSVSSLPAGIYHIVINDSEFKVVKSFVKG